MTSITRKLSAVLPAAVVVAALMTTPSVAATPTPTQALPGPTSQGIIMRDGGVCDPIRHMGC